MKNDNENEAKEAHGYLACEVRFVLSWRRSQTIPYLELPCHRYPRWEQLSLLLAEAPLFPEPVRDGQLVHAPLIPAHRYSVSPTIRGGVCIYLPEYIQPS